MSRLHTRSTALVAALLLVAGGFVGAQGLQPAAVAKPVEPKPKAKSNPSSKTSTESTPSKSPPTRNRQASTNDQDNGVQSGGGANGIYIGTPKAYSNSALEQMLLATRLQLAQINGVNPTALNSAVGTVQGGRVSQTAVGVQAAGPPTAGTQVTTAAPVHNVEAVVAPTADNTKTTTTDNSATNQTVLSTSPVTPTAPAQQFASLPIAPSSTFNASLSALDLLKQQLELSYESINWQLLLQGSLGDQLGRKLTIGIPISIETHQGFQYRDAVADIEFAICNPPQTLTANVPPSLVTVLPRERTYNVLDVVSKSTSLSGGAVLGVVNFSGGFLRGHETYYLAQAQDTISFERPPHATCQVPNSGGGDLKDTYMPVTVAWQLRPVLSQQVVSAGTREVFVQLSLPPGNSWLSCVGSILVTAGWRHYDRDTDRVGSWIEPPEQYRLPPEGFDLTPTPRDVQIADNSDGTVSVTANGTFLSDVRVRIGPTMLDTTSPGFEHNAHYVRFTASAAALAVYGARLVNGDGLESPVTPGEIDTSLEACKALGSGAVPSNSQQTKSDRAPTVQSPPPLDTPVVETVSPLTSAISRVTLKFEKAIPSDSMHVPVAVVGSVASGLRDAPFRVDDSTHLSFNASTDALRATRTIRWTDLRTGWHEDVKVPDAALSDFSVSAVTLLSSSGDGDTASSLFAISGTGLADGKLSVLSPMNVTDLKSIENTNGTLATFSAKKTDVDNTKNIVLLHDQDAPVILAMPPGPPPDKPTPSVHAALHVGDSKMVVTGDLLNTVVQVHYLGNALVFTLAADEKSLTVQLPPAATSAANGDSFEVPVQCFYADGTVVPFNAKVTKP
jgi:hypothetical protein